jgi:hypothetical protein
MFISNAIKRTLKKYFKSFGQLKNLQITFLLYAKTTYAWSIDILFCWQILGQFLGFKKPRAPTLVL